MGDGAIVARRADRLFVAVTRPPIGEYANETTFITSGQAIDTAQLSVQKIPITGVVLLSDGLQLLALKMPEGEPYGPFFEPLLDFAAGVDDLDMAQAELAAFLQSDRVAERTDDDLTLLLAVCAATAQFPETPDSLVQG